MHAWISASTHVGGKVGGGVEECRYMPEYEYFK